MFGKIREYFCNSIDRAEADLRLFVAFIVHFVVVLLGELAPSIQKRKNRFSVNQFASCHAVSGAMMSEESTH